MKTILKPRFTPILRAALLLAVGATFGLWQSSEAGLFSPKGGSAGEKRQAILKQREELLEEAVAAQPALKAKIQSAAGYATFKQTDVNLFMLASGRGYGVVRDNATGKETYMCVASLGGGVGLGVKDLRVLFIFNDAQVMKQFVDKGWQFGGEGNATAKYKDAGVAVEGGAKAQVDPKEGSVTSGATTDAQAGTGGADKTSASASTEGAMEIYQFTKSGLALQATIQGTKYWKNSDLN